MATGVSSCQDGGLGVTQLSLLAPHVYLASAASTVSPQKTIPEAAMCPEDEVLTAYMSK